MKKKGILLFLGVLGILLSSCGETKKMTEKTIDEAMLNHPEGERFIWVNSYKDYCRANTSDGLFFLTSETGIGENWDCIYSEIKGFEFEPGNTYQLRVKATVMEGNPELTWVETLSKERDADFYRIFNIWGLTHIAGNEINPATQSCQLEINLNTEQVLGNATCNSFSGSIQQFTKEKIRFGPLAATKKMCEEIGTERKYLAALAKTTSYRFEKGLLILMDEIGTPLLQFKPID